MAVIYLAGKIEKNCWRHEIVDDLVNLSRKAVFDSDDETLPDWGIASKSIFGEHDYAGPFFAACSHGAGVWHGPDTHGTGTGEQYCQNNSAYDLGETPNCCGDYIVERQWVHDQCLAAVRRSDIVFAWIESNHDGDVDCFGTIYELGLAKAFGKKILIASPERHFCEFINQGHWLEECKPHEVPIEADYWQKTIPARISDLWLCFQSANQTAFEATSAKDALHSFLYPQENQDPLANGYVYFIEATGIGHIKIGWSVNPVKRVAQLQTGSAARLQLLGFLPGKRAFEQKLHADFHHLRHHDEWFHGTEELRSYIKSQCGEAK